LSPPYPGETLSPPPELTEPSLNRIIDDCISSRHRIGRFKTIVNGYYLCPEAVSAMVSVPLEGYPLPTSTLPFMAQLALPHVRSSYGKRYQEWRGQCL